MALGPMFGPLSEGDEPMMLAFKKAQFEDPQSDEKWRTAARAFFESLRPFQKDIIGEILMETSRMAPDCARRELIRAGTEWRNDRAEHQVDWVTRALWPFKK